MSDEPNTSFEEALQRLTRIVEQLEHGDLPLDASLTLFEEGVRLARLSQARLDQAERRVEELLSVSSDGHVDTKPLETTR
jgi:exodeoxyribonuclease VII small subunit